MITGPNICNLSFFQVKIVDWMKCMKMSRNEQKFGPSPLKFEYLKNTIAKRSALAIHF